MRRVQARCLVKAVAAGSIAVLQMIKGGELSSSPMWPPDPARDASRPMRDEYYYPYFVSLAIQFLIIELNYLKPVPDQLNSPC